VPLKYTHMKQIVLWGNTSLVIETIWRVANQFMSLTSYRDSLTVAAYCYVSYRHCISVTTYCYVSYRRCISVTTYCYVIQTLYIRHNVLSCVIQTLYIRDNVLLCVIQTLYIRDNVLSCVMQTLYIRYNIIFVINYLCLQTHIYHPERIWNNWIPGLEFLNTCTCLVYNSIFSVHKYQLVSIACFQFWLPISKHSTELATWTMTALCVFLIIYGIFVDQTT
jgi:hypothetical protein